jgi:hypothetical protein
MIFDFGCSDNVKLLDKIIPAFKGVAAVLVVMAGLSSLGALLQRRTEFRATDIFCGWGFVVVLMVLTAITLPHAMFVAAVILGTLMLAATVRVARNGYFVSSFGLLALFPGLVLLTAINLFGISGWDDFSHWVPNALYVFQNNGVPGSGMPEPHSVWPSYPYAVPILTYLASQLAGGFLVQGGAMFNFVFLLTFAAMLAQTSAQSIGRLSANNNQTVIRMGLALLVTTLANPSFNASFTMTNEGDTSSMILVAALGLMLWHLIDAFCKGDRESMRDLTVQTTLSATAFVLIKQVDFILLGLLSFAFLVVAWKNNVFKSALARLALILIPACLMRFLWGHYVNTEMGGAGFQVMPLSTWRFDLVAPLLQAMMHEALRKSGVFGLALVIIGAGIVSLFKPVTPQRNFSLLAAIVCGGYIAFLFTTYIGSTFSDAEIRRAASFYRYSTHLGLLEVTFLWIAVPQLWARAKPKFACLSFGPAARFAYTLFLVSVLPLALAIHSYWVIREAGPKTCSFRDLGRKIAAVLPNHAHLVAVATDGDPFSGYVVNFELALSELGSGYSYPAVQHIVNAPNSSPEELKQHLVEGGGVDAILLQPSEAQKASLLILQPDHTWHEESF